MRKLLIVCGPTATGKTDLGISISKKFKGEIVSADSRQVYREMDILTGNDAPKNSIPVWLLDIVPPDYDFNVSDYFQLAKTVIEDIRRRDKLPVVVGGTGFYINSLLKTYDTVNIPLNESLRKELYLLDLEKLRQRLKDLDRKKINSMNNSDINNPRRLIRAIEVAVWKNNPLNKVKKSSPLISDSILLIGLTGSKKDIHKNIERRVNKRIKEGAVTEVKKILEKYKDREMISTAATGYKELGSYIKGECTLTEAVKLWITREQHYANRQLVWFKKMKDIHWYDAGGSDVTVKIEERVRKWYTQG